MLKGSQHDAGNLLTVDRQTLDLLAEFFQSCSEITKHAAARIAKIESLLEDVLLDFESLGQKAYPLKRIVQASMQTAGIEPMIFRSTNSNGSESNAIASKIFLHHQKNGGRWKVWINFSARPLELPNQVGGFLAFIASGPIARPGELVAFQSPHKLQEYAKESGCKTKPERHITVLVNKLRTALKEAELNPELVQRNPVDGVRFATRRQAILLQSPLIALGAPAEPMSGSA